MNRTSSARGGTILFVLILVVIAGIASVIFKPDLIKKNFSLFEESPPTISWLDQRNAVGQDPVTLRFRIGDFGRGIDEIVVRVVQGSFNKDLIRKSFRQSSTEPVLDTIIELPFAARELALRESPAHIVVSAFDRSFWSNKTETAFTVGITYAKPRLEVLSVQHNMSRGGSGLVFYKILSGTDLMHGVQVGSQWYPGFPASQLDGAFAKNPNIMAAFIAVPRDFLPAKDKVQVTATNQAGTLTVVSVNNRIGVKNFPAVTTELTADFLKRKLPELLPEYYERAGLPQKPFDAEGADSNELAAAFKLINETQREQILALFKELATKSAPTRLWSEEFLRPLAGKQTSQFSEERSYTLGGVVISSSVHDGVDLAATAQSVVRASNTGTVLFVGPLGLYGESVVLDHGFGLQTIYSHLNSVVVSVGERIERDAPLGRSGTSGLAGGDHLHFEIRLHGDSINPVEWYDRRWIKDHIDGKITLMRQLSVGVD